LPDHGNGAAQKVCIGAPHLSREGMMIDGGSTTLQMCPLLAGLKLIP
jgi:hypothetical protein